jgi:LysM repeat protein
MSMRLLAAFFICFVLTAPVRPAWAADPLKKPEDFRGMKWGVAAASQPGLTAVDRDGDITHFERSGEKKELGGIPLRNVTYSFFKDQFYHAEIGYEGEGAFDALQKSLEDKYGPPDAVRQKTDPGGHAYEVAVWNWPGYAFIGHRRDKDSPTGRIFYFYAPLTEASAKAQGIAPAKAPRHAASGAAGATYAVKKGDSLERIAKKFGVTEADLSAANAGLTDKALKAGATIIIPTETAKTAPPARESRRADDGEADVRPREKAAKPTTSGKYIEYTVKSGDVLSRVASKHGVKTSDIIAANPGIKPDTLSLGDVLKIPSKKSANP